MIDKKVLNGTLAMLSILILIIPISISGYIVEVQKTNIISVQGDYGIGETMGLYSGSDNVSEMFENYVPSYAWDSYVGFDANNETLFYGLKNSGSILLRDGLYFGNYNTYIGAGEHTFTPNWNDVDETTYNQLRQFYIPLNYTNEQVAEFDFIRIHSDIVKTNGSFARLYYEESGTSILQIDAIAPVDNETDLFVLQTSMKNVMNAYPDGKFYLSFVGIDDEFDETQSSFTWMVEANILEPSDYTFGSEYTDSAIWVMMVLGLDAFFLFVLIFANPMIDIKIDRSKGKK